MKKYMIWMALAALLLPALARGLWFYRALPPQQREIATPDYQSFAVSQPPLSTPLAAEKAKPGGGVVLFDMAHANQFQPSEAQSLEEQIARRGGSVETLLDAALLGQKLKYVSAYVVVSPSAAFTDEEIRLIRQFVERGGRLLVFTDATRGTLYYDWWNDTVTNFSDAAVVNPLLAPYGITVNNDYLYNVVENEGNYRNVFFDQFGKDELTFGLKRVAFYGAHSVKAEDGVLLLGGAASNLSSADDAHHPDAGGAVLSADGGTLVFGDFTFLSAPYRDVADNAALISNIADFVLGGKREVSLLNFPYVFSQPLAQVYPAEGMKLTAETIAAIGGLQNALDVINVELRVTDKPPRAGDVLVLGVFEDAETLEDFLAPFNLDLTESETTIALKKFGEVGRAGNGLLLFERGKDGNTLVLLANSQEDLVALISNLSGGGLSGCILQDNFAVCSVGYGGDSSGESAEEPPVEETPEGEAAPETQAEPAPVG